MPFAVRRPLVHALLVSSALHGVLLSRVLVNLPVTPSVGVPAVEVVMRPRAADNAPVPEVSPRTPVAAPVRPPSPRSNRSVQRPPVAAAPPPPAIPVIMTDRAAPTSTVPVAAPATPTVVDAGAVSPSAPKDAPGGGTGSKAGDSSHVSSAPSPEGVDTNDLADLRLALSKAAQRLKRYPALARERGWEGTVKLGLVYRAQVSSPDIGVEQSSGRTILDEQALDMLSRAVRTTTLPARLKGRDFRVTLSVTFSLEEER